MKDSLLTDSLLTDSLTNIKSVCVAHSSTISGTTDCFWGMPEGIARIVVPAGITLLVFVLGQIIIWYRSQTAMKNEVMNYRDIILTWIDLIQKPVEKQINSCRELSKNIANSQDIQPERFVANKMLAEKVDSIGIERYISTFMINTTKPKEENQNDLMTYNLISQFNFLKSIEPIIADTYKNYQTQIIELMMEWNNYFMKLDELTSNWSKIIVDNKHPYFAFQQEIVKISNNWIKTAPNGRSTMVHSMNNLITPLGKIVGIELNANIKNEYAFQLSAILQQLRIIDLKWKTNIEGNSKLFEDIANSIDNSYKALLNAKKYFQEKTEIKNLFPLRNK